MLKYFSPWSSKSSFNPQLLHYSTIIVWYLLGINKVADVSEAVRQYADALMLSGESAIGSFPEKALSVLQTASQQMELSNRREFGQSLLCQLIHVESSIDKVAEQICNSAVEMGTFLPLRGNQLKFIGLHFPGLCR